MVEETKELVSDEIKQELGEASLKRISIIYNLVKEYFRAINNGTMSALEFTMVGMDVVQAGLQLISRSNDMDNADVDTRIETMTAMKALVNNIFDKVYLNPEVVAGQVAKANIESLERKGLFKNLKEENK